MTGIIAAVRLLSELNRVLLTVGRTIGIIAIAVMVLVILIQVFFRYVLNNALPWPDEAARFCMLWMTALMAPTAYRAGGFVAIDTFEHLMPKLMSHLVALFLLLLSSVVLIVAVQIGYKEVTGIGGRFATASLYLPLSFSFDEWFRIPRSWMMLSLLVGFGLLISVNVELVLRKLLTLIGQEDRLPPIGAVEAGGRE